MTTRVIPPLCLALLYIPRAYAKFSSAYPGIATAGRDACTSNLTQLQITHRGSCRAIFTCIMNELDSHDQALLSSGSAILGFIPTVLTLLSSTNDDLLRIHAEYPVLALLLSFTNISTVSAHISKIRPTVARRGTNLESAGSRGKELGPYGSMIPPGPRRADSFLVIIAYHLLALIGAVVVIWQTIELGQKSVLTWACWTDFYPIIWVLVSVLQHVIATVCVRLSLHSHEIPRKKFPGVWSLRLAAPDLDLGLAHNTFAHWTKACVELLSNVNFLYGTVIFSSLNLVSGVNAIKILVLYGSFSAVTRIMTAWVLDN